MIHVDTNIQKYVMCVHACICILRYRCQEIGVRF